MKNNVIYKAGNHIKNLFFYCAKYIKFTGASPPLKELTANTSEHDTIQITMKNTNSHTEGRAYVNTNIGQPVPTGS